MGSEYLRLFLIGVEVFCWHNYLDPHSSNNQYFKCTTLKKTINMFFTFIVYSVFKTIPMNTASASMDQPYIHLNLDRFTCAWDKLHKEFCTTYTLKVHIMIHHVNDYVDMVGGGLLKRGSDQVTEVAHQLFIRQHVRWLKKTFFWHICYIFINFNFFSRPKHA